jgi:hypothetical protein
MLAWVLENRNLVLRYDRLGASADCPAPIIAGRGISICEPSINGLPVSVTCSAAGCKTTDCRFNDTVLGLADIILSV